MESLRPSVLGIDEGRKLVSSVSMTLVIISFSMLFATLFLSYILLRLNSPVWPPMGIGRVGLGLPTLSTVFIALSSFGYGVFERSYGCGRVDRGYFWVAFLAGVGFMIIQAMFWRSLTLQGIYAGSGAFGSVLYGLTWIHAAHIFVGLALLLWQVPLLKGYGGSQASLRLKNVGIFWHFLSIVWGLIFFGLFIF